MILVMILSMFGTAQPSLLAFPEERPVFLREYSTSHYSVLAYFTCRLFMEALVTFIQIMIQVRIIFLVFNSWHQLGIYLYATPVSFDD